MTPRDDSTCRRDGFPRSPRRTPAGNRTTARGRFPGFRVNAFARLPRACASVAFGRPLAGHSCGGSRGLKPRSLNPFREPHACLNANSAERSGSMWDCHDLCRASGILRQTVRRPGRIAGSHISAAMEMHTGSLWKSGWSNSPHFVCVRMNGVAEMVVLPRGSAAMRTRSTRVFKGIGAALHHSCATQSCMILPGLRSSHTLCSGLAFTN
jgi:hypothetical protein